MSREEFCVIGSTDYYVVYLIREGSFVTLKRMTAKTYEEMEEYIRENGDLENEWRDAVYHGNTEEGFDDWLQDYNYEYGDYFEYDNVVEIYYNGDDDDYMSDDFNIHSRENKEDYVDEVMDCFDEYYHTNNLEFEDIQYDQLRDKISEYYDKAVAYDKEREEASKPHWKAFSYYK